LGLMPCFLNKTLACVLFFALISPVRDFLFWLVGRSVQAKIVSPELPPFLDVDAFVPLGARELMIKIRES
jgi:hypothetical protein